MAGREAAHPFLRSLECGRRAQRGNGCVAAIDEKVCEAPFRFRRSKHELFVIASKADSALGLEALDDLKDLARVWATIDVVAEKDQLASLFSGVRRKPFVDLAEKVLELRGHAMNVADDDR